MEKIIGIVKIGAGGKIQLPQETQNCLEVKTGDTIKFKIEGLNDDVVILQKVQEC